MSAGFMTDVRKSLAQESAKYRRVRLAVRVIADLIPKEDRAKLRMVDAYSWRWSEEVTVQLRAVGYNLEASEALEGLRRKLVQEGCQVEVDRHYNKYTETLVVELAIKALAGVPEVKVHLGGLGLGPDCVIEEREVEELVEHQPEVEEHYEIKTQHVAICTDPVSGERKEVVI